MHGYAGYVSENHWLQEPPVCRAKSYGERDQSQSLTLAVAGGLPGAGSPAGRAGSGAHDPYSVSTPGRLAPGPLRATVSHELPVQRWSRISVRAERTRA